MIIRPARPKDAAAIAAIYAPYVRNTIISFEEEVPDEGGMRARIESGRDVYPWLVAVEDETVCGYAYASQFRPRPAYRYTVETTIYLAPAVQGRGVGRALYSRLVNILELQGFMQAMAVIGLPNPGSIGLHERLGFRQAGLYRHVGYKFGKWHDVGIWQRQLAASLPPNGKMLSAPYCSCDA